MRNLTQNSVLIISGDLQFKNCLREIIPFGLIFHYCSSLINSFSEIGRLKFKVIIIDESICINNKKAYLMLIKDIGNSYIHRQTIIFRDKDTEKYLSEYIKFQIRYILEKPIKRCYLIPIINDLLGKFENTRSIIVTKHGINLYVDLRYLIFKGCKIYLTHTERDLMCYILDANSICETKELLKYLSFKKGRVVSQSYLSVNISRLREKFINNTGLDVIKNRKSFGYYISV